MSALFVNAAPTLVVNSGALVPKATTVNPITKGLIRAIRASEDAPRTKASPPTTSNASPPTIHNRQVIKQKTQVGENSDEQIIAELARVWTDTLHWADA